MKAENRIQEAFGRAVRKARTVAGISQEELAARADLHRTYIGDIERGERNVSLLNMSKIAEALKVKFSLLVRQTEKNMSKAGASKKE